MRDADRLDLPEQWRREAARELRARKRDAAIAEPESAVNARRVARLYFMREPHGPVKIGITHVGVNSRRVVVQNRLRMIESASGRRMVLLADVPGSRQAELATHVRFAHLRTVGEWFRPGPELLEYIAALGVS